MAHFDPRTIRGTYEAVAGEYAAAFADDLERLEFDRAVLDAAASRMEEGGPVLDIGCGPGQVAAYLLARGVQSFGVDLAPRMLEVARRRTRELQLLAADMRALPIARGSCAGAVAFYSLQYVPRGHIGDVLTEVRRVLKGGAVLVLATHLGAGEIYGGEEWFGHKVEPIGATLHSDEELVVALRRCGFEIDSARRRHNLPHEAPTERLYVTAAARAD
jgi:ubiquinone/menaquinone biosynthesis C-methylase UbiE